MAYAFANNFSDLQSQINARRAQDSSNLFNSLQANRTAQALAQSQRQSELNNALNMAGLIANARSAQSRQALSERENQQGLNLSLLQESGLNRRAQLKNESDRALKMDDRTLARQYREEDLGAAREDRNLQIGLKLIADQAVPPEMIDIPLTEESRKLLKNQYLTFRTQESEGNKRAQEIADRINTSLSSKRMVAQKFLEMAENPELRNSADVRSMVSNVLKDSGVSVPLIPASKSQLPQVAMKVLEDAVTEAKTEAGKWAQFNPETMSFSPIISNRYQERGDQPAQPTEGQAPLSGAPDGPGLTRLFHQQGMSLQEAAARAHRVLSDPRLRSGVESLFSTNGVANGTP